MSVVTLGILMGVGATAAMDLWALVMYRVAGIAPPNWAMVGRWVGHLPGRVVHDNIAGADPVDRELRLGWAFHYLVGIVYGIVFALIAGPAWLAEPTFFPAWIFAVATIAAGWFILQPGLGLGVAASRTENPWKVRGLGLAAHTVFGLGLWGTALLL